MKKFATVILAAGPATEFGDCKVLAPINERPMLDYSIQAARTITQDIIVVTGCWHQAIQQAQQQWQWPIKLLYIENWADGINSVIAATTTKLEEHYDALLFMLADQPAVTTDNLALVCNVFHQHKVDAVCCQYLDSVGVPAIADRSLYPTLKTMQGDDGAFYLLKEPHLTIKSIQLDQCNIDIDTKQDLDDWIHCLNFTSFWW